KVSAKEVLNRNELKSFHQDLDNHLKERIPQIYQKGVLNDKTIGVENVETLKKHSAEIERLSEGMEEKKRAINKEFKQVNQLEGKVRSVHDTREKLDEFEKNLGRTITGKRIMSSKDLNELKKFVTGIHKNEIRQIKVARDLKSENRELSNDLHDTSEKLNLVEEQKRDLIHDNDYLESKIERLETKNSVLEDKLAVANSKLLENGYDLSKMPEIELKGRLVIDRLENGYEPKNKKVADNWKDILQKNKDKKLINSEKLNQAMEKLKLITQKIISKVKDIGLSL